MGLIARLLVLTLLVAGWAGTAAADADRVEAAWRDWARQTGVGATSIAIVRDRQVVRALGIGMEANAPAPLASLSKTIIGSCVMELERRGTLSRSQTMAQLLGPSRIYMTDGAARIAVAELLTHSSGLATDSTQGRPSPWRAAGGDRTLAVTRSAMARTPGPKRFFYNNENYAVLGTVIAAVTGQSAAQICPRLLGIDARVSAEFGGGVPWGGFEMSAPAFAAFAARLQPQSSWPTSAVRSDVLYGPGVLYFTDRRAMWHFGSWCFIFGRSAGAYFFQKRDGWGATVTFNRCLSREQTHALDIALADAVR